MNLKVITFLSIFIFFLTNLSPAFQTSDSKEAGEGLGI